MAGARSGNPRVKWGALLRHLGRFYATGNWRVPAFRDRGADPFGVMVSTVLSQRTRDEVTERVAGRLLAVYPTASALATAPRDRVVGLIREVGLAESKANGLQATAGILAKDYCGKLPRVESELIQLPLIGRKTAKAILVFGYGIPAIPTDIHIHRVANRLGVVTTKSAEETSLALEKVVPKKYWHLLNPALVQHGQNICTALNPKCAGCPIRNH